MNTFIENITCIKCYEPRLVAVGTEEINLVRNRWARQPRAPIYVCLCVRACACLNVFTIQLSPLGWKLMERQCLTALLPPTGQEHRLLMALQHTTISWGFFIWGGGSFAKRKRIFMCCILFKTDFKFHPWEPVKEEICVCVCVCQWVLLHGFLGGRASCGFRYGLLSASIRRLYFCLPPRTRSRRTPEKQRQKKKGASIHNEAAAKQNICQHEGNNKQK